MLSLLKSAIIPNSHDDLLHLCAHVGTSFMIQTMLCKIVAAHLLPAIFGIAVISLIVGMGYKVIECAQLGQSPWTAQTITSMMRNSIGIALAIAFGM